jgi:hypothetical protein
MSSQTQPDKYQDSLLPVDIVPAGKEEEEELFGVIPVVEKRKRKQANPKQLTTVLDAGFIVTKKSRKSQAVIDESEKMKAFIATNMKHLRTESKMVVQDVFQEYAKELACPDVIKAYLLGLFYFCDSNEITISQVFDFDNTVITSPSAFDKLERLQKLPAELALPEEHLEMLYKKYGKKYWKVPKQDYEKIKSILKEKGVCTCHLISATLDSFENKMSKSEEEVRCLKPKVRYE